MIPIGWELEECMKRMLLIALVAALPFLGGCGMTGRKCGGCKRKGGAGCMCKSRRPACKCAKKADCECPQDQRRADCTCPKGGECICKK